MGDTRVDPVSSMSAGADGVNISTMRRKRILDHSQVITEQLLCPWHCAGFLGCAALEVRCGLTGLKSRLGCVPSGGSREELFACLFQFLKAAPAPWLMAPSTFKAALANQAFYIISL